MNCADQCRAMGLAVGDKIVGREGGGRDWWSESELTLIFLGNDTAVFSERRRNSEQPDWADNVDSGNWTLECRDWKRVNGTMP